MDPWVVEVLWCYFIPFLSLPRLSQVPVPFDSYSPTSTKAIALHGEISSVVEKGGLELAPPSPGFYSRMFVILEASGSWRRIIDLSILNKFIHQTKFKMETSQSVLGAIQRDDWMFSIDLKDAYIQVIIHQESRKCLCFVTFSKVFQFMVLCFSLSTTPQVFTRVMAPVSAILHRLGVWIL